jgi:glycosyltransferase involved in cell wall biosynthesis
VAGRLAGVPVRWGSVRGSLNLVGFQSLPAFYRQASIRWVSHLTVNATTLTTELEQAGVNPKRITLLPNAVPVATPNEQPADLTELGIASNDFVIGTVGNLRAVKNHRLLIDAMADVIAQQPTARGVIVGQTIPDEADLPHQLQARIMALGLDKHIILTGFRADVGALLHRFDIFCLTSRNEGVPNALLEAMAVGTPVIATAVGGIPDIIYDGENGLLISSEDTTALTQAIICLMAQPKRAKSLGVAGQRSVMAQFDCQVVADKLGNLYVEAVG